MTHLSENFTDVELEVVGAPERVIEKATWLCVNVLEPMRRHFGKTIKVTSGYRPPKANEVAGGANNSFHMYQGDECASDIEIPGMNIVDVFDQIRMHSFLPFHKVILEKDHKTGLPHLVHIQAHTLEPVAQRQAFIGETYGTGKYTQVECA